MWTTVRAFSAVMFFGSAFMQIFGSEADWSHGNTEHYLGSLLGIVVSLFIGWTCFRATIENSNVWSRQKVNPIRKFDFSGWKI
jgi:hypothetical protein